MEEEEREKQQREREKRGKKYRGEKREEIKRRERESDANNYNNFNFYVNLIIPSFCELDLK